MMDMLVNLQRLPSVSIPAGVRVVRALPPDHAEILAFIREHFSEGWVCECRQALAQQPNACFVAVMDGRMVGLACYDATARGFFGPLGVEDSCRGGGVGRALLLTTLRAMADAGYGYAVIGWCDGARAFYERIGAVPILDSAPENSVYGRMIHCCPNHEEE